jgi:rhomboid-like protein
LNGFLFSCQLLITLFVTSGFSLGASGAIMAILAFVCAQYPDTKLSIIFLPQIQFTAGNAIFAILGIELSGILFGWRFFDHAAHLGGALVGMFWCYYGTQSLWPLRENLVVLWHELRGKIK